MEKVSIGLEPKGAERLPLTDLLELGERRLVEWQVAERASKSSLYRKRWRKAGADATRVKSRRDLRSLPFSSGSDILEAQKRSPLRQLPCAKVWAWFATDTTGDGRKWIPYGKQDVLQYMGLLARLGSVIGVDHRELFLAVTPMAPRVANAVPYLWMYADMLERKEKLEFIVGSMFMLGRSNWPEFALRKQPTVLLCRPDDALTLVEHFAQAAGSPDAKPRDLFTRLKKGIFFGQPLAPLRDDIRTAYDVELFDCYLSAEFPSLSAECSAHEGLHVWLDVCIPEVIPKEELAKEKAQQRYVPQALFLEEATPGEEGEYVLTTFGEALPLVRYRTGDLVRVVSTEPCNCGITHPRIAILGKV
ncbi:MAG: phenylacetate--CoA ligase family protein [Anaerolineales bacterium]|nr:MAG: phenylacetate--CoA ligase family protein [Anaerolineales bacterium]